MTELKPNYKPVIKPMSLEQAIASRMTESEYIAYMNLHEISITRRDD